MSDVPRTSPEEAHRRVVSGEALLVCAYDDEEKCRGMKIDDALTMGELRRRLDQLPRDTTIVFYCA